MTSSRTLGTLLRHLIEHLDEAVEERYQAAGLDYKPRYTPIIRALLELKEAPLREIAKHAGITHSAVSQTVAQMQRADLVESLAGADLRQNIVRLTAKANRMMPQLRSIWLATSAAAEKLDAELPYPISALTEEAIRVLESRPFGARIGSEMDALKPSRKTK